MAGKNSLELKIKGLEQSFGTIVKAFKDMRASMNMMEEKLKQIQNEKVEEIIEAQKNLNEMMAVNSNAIQRIDNEILKFHKDKANAASDTENEIVRESKKCNYYNRGHSKYKVACKFTHPKEICKIHLEGKKCDDKHCNNRHPKSCKWLQEQGGCKRQNCDYFHVTLACGEGQQNEAHNDFHCSGCKNNFEERSYVVDNIVHNHSVFLCLNCDSWIKKKENILNWGWSLFDNNGDLRRDV